MFSVGPAQRSGVSGLGRFSASDEAGAVHRGALPLLGPSERLQQKVVNTGALIISIGFSTLILGTLRNSIGNSASCYVSTNDMRATAELLAHQRSSLDVTM